MPDHAAAGTSSRRGVLLALTTAILWGTIPIAGKVALQGIQPVALSFLRLAAAGFLMLAFLRIVHPRDLASLRRPPLLVAAIAGLALAGNYVLYLEGLARTTATAAQLIIQLASVFLVIWGVVLFHEEASRIRVAGTLSAVAGVLLVSWNGHPLTALLDSRYLVGNLFIAAAALSWSFYAVAQKRMNAGAASGANLAIILLIAALVTSVPAIPAIPSSLAWLPLVAAVYLVLNTFVAYGAFAESLRHLDASKTAVITTFAPVITMILVLPARFLAPTLFSGDALTGYTVAGAALILGGILLVVREGRDARALDPSGAPEDQRLA